MLLLTHFHSDSWLSSRRERNACFLSLLWHFIQSGLSIHSVKLQAALGGRELTRLAQGLRMVAALFSSISPRISQGSKSVPVIPKRIKSHLGFVCLFCGFGLGFFWSRILFSAKSCLLHTGWEEGSSHFSLPDWPGWQQREGTGLQGSKDPN